MKERIALLATGAACTLAGVVIAGGPATAQQAHSSATDTQVKRSIDRMSTKLSRDLQNVERAVNELRGQPGGLTGDLAEIEDAVEKTCQAVRGSSLGC